MAVWLVIVPLGKNSAASFRNISATFCSRAFTVGSALKTSSPTSADIMASSMAGVGLVTVSLIRFIFMLSSIVKCQVQNRSRAYRSTITKSCSIEKFKDSQAKWSNFHILKFSNHLQSKQSIPIGEPSGILGVSMTSHCPCLLYTSDAADDLLCVDLG